MRVGGRHQRRRRVVNHGAWIEHSRCWSQRGTSEVTGRVCSLDIANGKYSGHGCLLPAVYNCLLPPVSCLCLLIVTASITSSLLPHMTQMAPAVDNSTPFSTTSRSQTHMKKWSTLNISTRSSDSKTLLLSLPIIYWLNQGSFNCS